MTLNVISKKPLREFWDAHPDAQAPLEAWYKLMTRSTFTKPQDVKDLFGARVDFVGDNRAIFDIGGNKYRIVAHMAYEYKAALIKFIGTHEEYDEIDAETV